MELSVFKKMMPVNFIKVNGKEFELGELLKVLSIISDTMVNDDYAEYAVRDYNINTDIADDLVELGYVERINGYRQARCYKKAESFDKFYETIENFLIENNY